MIVFRKKIQMNICPNCKIKTKFRWTSEDSTKKLQCLKCYKKILPRKVAKANK